MGAVGTATVDFGTGAAAISQDATKGWWLPASNTEWANLIGDLNLASPLSIWGMQDAGSPLVDANAVKNAVSSGTPSYQQTVPGWTRKGVTVADASTNTIIAQYLDREFQQQSFLLLQVLQLRTPNAAVRQLLMVAGQVGGGKMAEVVNNNQLQLYDRAGGTPTENPGGTINTDAIVALLWNPVRYSTLQNTFALADNGTLVTPVGTLEAMVSGANTNVCLVGATGGTIVTSDAYRLYSTLFAAPDISIANAQAIMKRMTTGPLRPFPGSSRATVTVTGQAAITPTSHVEAWIQGTDSTASHNAYEHSMVPMNVRVENIVNGVGFDITCTSDLRLNGTFKVHWVWN